MANFHMTLTPLSPVHIGCGIELRQGFDFMPYNGFTYRLNEDAVLQAKAGKLLPDRSGKYPLPGSLLTEADFASTQLFRYIIKGIPRSKKEDARVQACIKDVYDRPYIPGSSLKGALRTALAWAGWEEVNPPLDRAALGRSRAWAAQPLERKFFGGNPNEDLMRAVQVGDLMGPQNAGEGLILINAQVLTRRNAGSPVELEALRPNIEFHGEIHIDDSLFSSMAEPRLRFSNRRHWLDELLPRAQKHSLERAARLADWFDQMEGCERIAGFYHQIAELPVAKDWAVLQLGWGTGWDGMTFGTRLQGDKRLFEQIVSDYRMVKTGRSAPRRVGDPFPRSKRVAMTVKQGIEQPTAPLGWVKLEFNKA
ncbi:MAG TPA: type III-A CRISPR-associated RAMP protein Csm5 [Anaerolineaceae bacterium]|nr:type III-A CRISPR-associated RAMP protein Csm5 [Anaerolineaceae bacterium]